MIKYQSNNNKELTLEQDIKKKNNDRDMLDLNLLLTKRRAVINRKHEIYRQILQKCHKRITYQANKRPDLTWCVFEIPDWIPGLPRFNKIACTQFCLSKLRKNGFMINYTPPSTLFISWQHYEEQQKRKAKLKKIAPMFRNKEQKLDKKLSYLDTIPLRSNNINNQVPRRPF